MPNIYIPCIFQVAGSGACKQASVEGEAFCAQHVETACVSCGEPATHECGYMIRGTKPCRKPLCDLCQHSRGNQREHNHVRKQRPNNNFPF